MMANIIRKFKHKKVVIATGSTSRHRSILEGLKVVERTYSKEDLDVIVVHDAVRPLVDGKDITSAVQGASQYGAAGLVRPLVSTILEVAANGFMVQSLDRNKHRASEMPQAFKYHILIDAYQKCTEFELEHGTECLHLVQSYTEAKVKLLDGPEHLWKITYKNDMDNFEKIIRAREMKNHLTIIHKDGDEKLSQTMQENLHGINTVISSWRYHDIKVANFCADLGTVLLLEVVKDDSFCGSLDVLPTDCSAGCIKQIALKNGFSDSPQEMHVGYIFEAVDVIHNVIAIKKIPVHWRFCFVCVLVGHHSTMFQSGFAKLIQQLENIVRNNHKEECYVSINAAVFSEKEITDHSDLENFYKKLHFMKPGSIFVQ